MQSLKHWLQGCSRNLGPQQHKKDPVRNKGSLIEIKNSLQGNHSRVDEAENQINDLEHKEAKNNQSEQDKKRFQKNKDSISSLWDNVKGSNILIIGVPEGGEKEQEMANLFEKNNERKLP